MYIDIEQSHHHCSSDIKPRTGNGLRLTTSTLHPHPGIHALRPTNHTHIRGPTSLLLPYPRTKARNNQTITNMARKTGPNVSHYLANLNNLNAIGEGEDLSFQNDLSSFTTTEFFDFDMGDGGIGNLSAPTDFDANHTERKQSSAWEHEPLATDFLGGTYYLTIVVAATLYFLFISPLFLQFSSVSIFHLQFHFTTSVEHMIVHVVSISILQQPANSRTPLYPTCMGPVKIFSHNWRHKR